MVMQADVVYDAYKSIKDENAKVIYLTPQGKVLNQKKVEELRELAKKDLDQAILYSLSHNIIFLTKKLSLIHPLTISAYNYLIKEKNE